MWRGVSPPSSSPRHRMLLPGTLLRWNGAPLRLYLLEGSGFLLRLLALAGWARVMGRSPAPAACESRPAEIAECVFLSLFFVAIGSGLLTAASYRWGSSWAGATLAPYLASPWPRGAPVTSLVEKMPFLVQLHVLSPVRAARRPAVHQRRADRRRRVRTARSAVSAARIAARPPRAARGRGGPLAAGALAVAR